MIVVTDKTKCSGCTACYAVCPVKAICMEADEEGFLYPRADKSKCVNCHICESVCPIANHAVAKEDLKLCFAAKNRNEPDRAISSSGGMFIACAKKILHTNGIIFGSGLNADFLAEHFAVETEKELPKIVGSKYMQSIMGDIFLVVREKLLEGRTVLFCGTSCQVGGLKAYLGKDYKNLFCIDFICLGVPSPKIWHDYLHSFFDVQNIDSINFKDKSNGWHRFSLRIQNKDNSSFVKVGANTYFFTGYFNGLYSRPCCGECVFKYDSNRISDITISDCWGSEHIAPELDDNKGVSSVVVHSEKGVNLFNAVSADLIFQRTGLDDVKKYNSGYCVPRKQSELRSLFWRDYTLLGAKKAFKKYCRPTKQNFFLRLARKAKQIMKGGENMNVKKLLSVQFYVPNRRLYREYLPYDRQYNMKFYGGGVFLKSLEWKTIVLYRKCQSNKDTIWRFFYEHKLARLGARTGIDFGHNYSIGKGLIIGHWGRIILNGNAVFGDEVFLTHGVNVGRDIRGKRAGCPTFGNRVCIRGNSTVVGNVHIGNDVLIAPNTFVNFDVPDHSVVIGNPAAIHFKENATEGHLPTL